MNAPLMLSQLAAAWKQAKADEASANARRLEIEQAICAALPAAGAECVEKAEADGVRVKVTYKVTRAVDSDALSAAWATLSEQAQKAFRWKADINIKAMRALQDMLPDEYKRIADYVETKPAKPSVVVEEG